MPITIDSRAFEKIFREAGETTVVQLTGEGSAKDVLIKDVQFHLTTTQAIHVDFYVLEKGKKVTLDIPLEFVGVAPAEKAGHILVKALHEVEIEVAANEIPHTLQVDISVLANVGDHITAGEIKLPASAELLTEAAEIVASVTEFKEVKEEAPAAPAAEAAPAAVAEGEKKAE